MSEIAQIQKTKQKRNPKLRTNSKSIKIVIHFIKIFWWNLTQKLIFEDKNQTQKHENFGCERNGDANTAAKSKTMVSFFSFFVVPYDPLDITIRYISISAAQNIFSRSIPIPIASQTTTFVFISILSNFDFHPIDHLTSPMDRSRSQLSISFVPVSLRFL